MKECVDMQSKAMFWALIIHVWEKCHHACRVLALAVYGMCQW